MRELHIGDRCEHVERTGSVYTGYRDVQCAVTHLSRIDGKPQQLVLVKEGRTTRKVCLLHAPSTSIKQTKPRASKKQFQAEQLDLL